MRNVVPAGLLVAVLASGAAFAQQARDWDAVELTIHHVAGDIYYLEGAGGELMSRTDTSNLAPANLILAGQAPAS